MKTLLLIVAMSISFSVFSQLPKPVVKVDSIAVRQQKILKDWDKLIEKVKKDQKGKKQPITKENRQSQPTNNSQARLGK